MNAVSIRRLRRATQLATVLAFLLIPLLNAREMYFFVGNMAAFNAGGVPLADPLAMLQVAAATFSATPSMLAGAGISLLLAVVLGPVFCSWLCPFGFLSELARRGKKKNGVVKASFNPFLIKSGIAAAGLLAILTFVPMPLLTQLSMPAWFTQFWQHAITHRDVLWPAVVLIPAALLLEVVANSRLWCRYVCPQSVLISLAGLAFPKRLQVRFARRACTCKASDRACVAACSLDLNPRETTPAQKLECTNCGDCIDACAKRGGALRFGFAPECENAGKRFTDVCAKAK